MNETLKLQHSHRSERAFSDEAISDAELDAIVEAAWRAPTSINSQQISLVVVRDAGRRAKIAEIAGGQPWIAKAPVFITVVIDQNKTALAAQLTGQTQIIHESVEGFASAAVDAGIALGNLMIAARSLGLGIVPIGGIRRDPQALIDLLKLPPQTYPIAGVSIGHVETAATQKPRLPLPSFRHDEEYDAAKLEPAILAYDKTLSQYWRDIGRDDGLPWSVNTAGAYSKVYFPKTRPSTVHQGFLNDK